LFSQPTGNDNIYGGGAIKRDLDWVVTGWNTNTCDLWEEVQSTDFFWNRMAHNR
jgi:glucoamylase